MAPIHDALNQIVELQLVQAHVKPPKVQIFTRLPYGPQTLDE
jgi:hypothetical protein